MSSCLSGAGRAYTIDLDIVKSPSTSSTRTTTSQSSSPSSTLSESSNSPIKISTRKPRTPRKRPNQTYNEAAALLSTVYPNIFSIKSLRKPFKHSKPCDSFSEDSSELLPPFPTFCNTELLIHQPIIIPEKPKFRIESKPINYCEKPCQSTVSWGSPSENFEEDFDTESMLDEEMEEGIDSIMGNLSVNNDAATNNFDHPNSSSSINYSNPFYANSILGFGGKFDFRGVSALRQVDNGDWWRFPTVDVLDISPKLNTSTTTTINTTNTKAPSEKKKKKKKVEKTEEPSKATITSSSKETEDSNSRLESSTLGLKLNYEDVLMAWSDRGLPFSDDISSESDAIARLAQIDLFGENGGLREASVLRYREKRRTRLFSKKIRYQVRKVNADRRPRMKGRFVRRPGQLASIGAGQR